MSLKSCLEQSLVLELRAMARQLGIKLRSLIKVDIVSQLEQKIQEEASLGHWAEQLSEEAMSALSYLLDRSGSSPMDELAARFGELRPVVRSAIESQQPWSDGYATALDQLHVRGLLFRLETEERPLAHVPAELVERLRPGPAARPQVFKTCPPPVSSSGPGTGIVVDLMLLASGLRTGPAPQLSGGGLPRRDLLRLNAHLLNPSEVADGAGERSVRRFLFLRLMAEEVGLIGVEGGRFASAAGLEEWLSHREYDQIDTLVEAYVRSAAWSELEEVPCLQFVNLGPPIETAPARRFLLGLLGEAESNQWYAFPSLVQACRTRNSFLLRRPGDGRIVRCTTTGRELGARDWSSVEGGWIEAAVRGPLTWLGLVQPGFNRKGELTAFRVPDARRLQDCLDGRATGAPEALEALEHRVESGTVQVNPDLTVLVGCGTDLARWYRLEQFCELHSRGAVSRYRLSRERFRQHLQSGGDGSQVRRALGEDVPDSVCETLSTWANRFGQVRVFFAPVLLANDPALMTELRSAPEVSSLLDRNLGSRASTIRPGKEQETIDLLRARGEMPHVERPAESVTLGPESWMIILQALELYRQQAAKKRLPQPDQRLLQIAAGMAALGDEDGGSETTPLLNRLEDAIRRRATVTFEYQRGDDAEPEQVVVLPKTVGQHHGETYLAGYRKGGGSLSRFCVGGIRNLTFQER